MATRLKRKHHSLAILLVQRGDFSGALSHYQQAITLHPSFAQAYNNMGSALAAQGRFEGAIAHFEQAINFDSHYKVAQKNLDLARSLVGKK
jgi:superkiller protein 3